MPWQKSPELGPVEDPAPDDLLLQSHLVVRVFENLRQHVPFHLCWLLDPVDMQVGRRDVEYARLESHQSQIMLDSRAHRKEGARNVVTISEIMFGDDRSRLLMIHVGVRIGLLELAQWLDAVIGDDKHVGVVIHMLQYRTQHLVESDVLAREGIRAN